jgi:hypothetical protein
MAKLVIYLRSFLAGIGALISFFLLFVTVGVRLFVRRPPDLPDVGGYPRPVPSMFFPSCLLALIEFAKCPPSW